MNGEMLLKTTHATARGGLYYLCVLASCAALGGTAHAQVVPVPSQPQIGSANPVTAEPPVPRPHAQPCIVQLFQNAEFANFTPNTFTYTPPAGCHGPWQKVVLTADFTVTAGIQYDRTAAFYLGKSNIYFGTTAEPGPTLSPSWHIERDVTDLSAVFATAHDDGEANIGNFVGVSGGTDYNGIIYASAALEFYPADGSGQAPRTADIVVPVEGSGGDAGTLNTGSDQVTATLQLPRNVEGVYLDVISQSQSSDEFWYFCVPNDQTTNLESCGNTAFRETEVSIDGQPAGVAPVYPWIFTGGIDPYLWQPIPGVQTLDFRPYRVNLTPFAGLLADGNPHVLAISVYNADSWFSVTGNVLVFTDPGARQVTGGVLSNTLSAAPAPRVTENIKVDPTGTIFTGTVAVGSRRQFAISGYVQTSHGRVTTTVAQTVDFLSTQTFDVSPSTDIQDARQLTTVDSRVSTDEEGRESVSEQHFSYPLTVDFSFVTNADGTYTESTTADQRDIESTSPAEGSGPPSALDNHVHAADALQFDASFNFTGNTGTKTTQTYRAIGPAAGCWNRSLVAQANVLTSVSGGECTRPGW